MITKRKITPAVVGFGVAAVIDAAGGTRVALDAPRGLHDWLLVGYLYFAAVLFAVASLRRSAAHQQDRTEEQG